MRQWRAGWPQWRPCRAEAIWSNRPPQPWVLERELIRILDVPLNLQDDQHNPFHAVLTRLRAEAGRNARELPMLDE
jgi:hypothetical protein